MCAIGPFPCPRDSPAAIACVIYVFAERTLFSSGIPCAKSEAIAEESVCLLYTSITDAVLLNKAVAGAVALESQQQKNEECDASGDLSSNDSVILMKFLVSLVKTLPSAE